MWNEQYLPFATLQYKMHFCFISINHTQFLANKSRDFLIFAFKHILTHTHKHTYTPKHTYIDITQNTMAAN